MLTATDRKPQKPWKGNVNHANIDIQAMLVWLILPLKIGTPTPTPALRNPQTSTPWLKADTDYWICVIVTAYWVNDADRQIRKIF